MTSYAAGNSVTEQAIVSRALLVRLWERMGVLYGREWEAQYGPTPVKPGGRELTIFGVEWASVIRGLSQDQVMAGCDKARDSGISFAPRAPEFRAYCFDIPTRDECEAYLRGQRDPTPFTREVARSIDMWNWKGSPTWEANKILQRAYDDVKKRILAGEVLPELDRVLEHKPAPHVPASAETAAANIAKIRAALGLRDQESP